MKPEILKREAIEVLGFFEAANNALRAELARRQPLIEAAEKATLRSDELSLWFSKEDEERILRAALKFRAAEKGEGT